MSVEAHHDGPFVEAAAPPASGVTGRRRKRRSWALRWRRALRSMNSRFSSSLTRRIVVLNLGGLVALLGGFLYLNQFRAGALIDTRIQTLQTLGQVIAGAVAASATVEGDAITIDPEKLLQLAPGQSFGLGDESDQSLDFSINPDRVGPVLRRLVSPTHTRGRIYDRDGYLLFDSASVNNRSTITRSDLPPEPAAANVLQRLWSSLRTVFGASDLPLYQDVGAANGRGYPEVDKALDGAPQADVRVNTRGETIVSMAVPIQRFRVVRGVLLLNTQGGEIDKVIASERWAIVWVFLVAAAVMLVLSLSLASTIAEPMRKLAEAADRVRRGSQSRQEIPDFSARPDEIGHLSAALRDMTAALYNRMDAIESFAADVAHELKNPLTSLRSAVETLPIARTEESRARLLDIVKHDVRRLDRLITDISDASRLDAELARDDAQPVDLVRLLQTVIAIAEGVSRNDGVTFSLDVAPLDTLGSEDTDEDDDDIRDYVVTGHDSRLGQVITNLIDNARSFSPRGGSVRLALRRAFDAESGKNGVEIVVDDDGPGIPPHAFERIFERFYTDRPTEGFGQNSGLGLSISRQIVEAHGGRIAASNRVIPRDAFAGGSEGGSEEDILGIDPAGVSLADPAGGAVSGARFAIWLPFSR